MSTPPAGDALGSTRMDPSTWLIKIMSLLTFTDSTLSAKFTQKRAKYFMSEMALLFHENLRKKDQYLKFSLKWHYEGSIFENIDSSLL